MTKVAAMLPGAASARKRRRARKSLEEGALRMPRVGCEIVHFEPSLVDHGDASVPVDEKTHRNREGLRTGDQIVVRLLQVAH